MTVELNVLVGGEAGQGIQTIGFVLGKTMARGGLHVFADQDYESRIRGGHNFFRVRVSDKEIKCQHEKVDIIIALNTETVERHRAELKEHGLIILDNQNLKIDSDDKFMDVPLEKLAEEQAGNKIMSNSVAVGAVLGLLKFDVNCLFDALRWHFAKNGQKVQEDNIKAAQAGYEYTVKRIPKNFNISFQTNQDRKCMFLNGHEALALGAMAAGCKYFSAYPMTPTTSILEFMAEKGRKINAVVMQPEDEIAAINNVVGAAYAGVRAMTATSGSGFALMVEGLGLAGITETPVVVVLGERPGPAVGLPTRTEQGELLFAIRVGTGEFPRAVLTPANPEDAFWLTVKAFNLAEKYQTPVIILTDTHLANSYNDIAKFNLKDVKIERGNLLSDEAANKIADYKRYQLTDSGISPRAVPGRSHALVVADSDEHNESGHLIENAMIRTQQVSKRLKKYEGLKGEIANPRYYEMPDAEIILVGWGSTYGAIMEASEMLKNEGTPNSVLHFSEVWPFPSDFVSKVLQGKRKAIVIENNATGQLAELIRAETGIQMDHRVNKWDGRPMSVQYIIDAIKKV